MLAAMRFAPMSWLAAFLMLATAAFAEDPQRILFIGNSYTGVNKLPDVFLEVVKDSGRSTPVVKSSTPGGRTLKQHLGIAGSMKLVDEGGWDVVVLQGLSQEPAIAEVDETVRKEFVAIASAFSNYLVLASYAALPQKTSPDVVAFSKANPGKVNYGSAGTGSSRRSCSAVARPLTPTRTDPSR